MQGRPAVVIGNVYSYTSVHDFPDDIQGAVRSSHVDGGHASSVECGVEIEWFMGVVEDGQS